MKVFLHQEDVFRVEAEAVLLPVDLSAKNMGGAIVRQLIKIIGDDAWPSIEDQIVFPYPNGRMQVAEMESPEVSFKNAVFLGSLTHAPEQNPVAVLRSALDHACEWAERMSVRRLATPILSGGHRLRPELALQVMLSVADRHPKGEMHIAVPDPKLYAMARPLVG